MQPKAIIIGSGAIGVALYTKLVALGLQVGFVGRSGPQAVQALYDGAPAVDAPPVPLDSPGIVLALLAVKAFDLEQALTWTRALPAGALVLPLSNGAVGALVEAAAQRRPDLQWRLGYCTFGVTAVGPQHYKPGSLGGELGFGPLHGETLPTALEQRWLAAEPLLRWHAQIVWMHRRKWLFNTVINTLTAARRLPQNGLLLGDLPSLAALFSEALALGQELWGPWPLKRDEIYQALLRLIEATAANENSMARDVRLGRPTESPFLAGLAADERRFPLLTGLHLQIMAPP